jgi:flagellar motor switch protein FliN/FliY
MAFSASPMVPEQRSGDAGGWDAVAAAGVAAVQEALPQIPTAAPLTASDPISDVSAATLPDPAGAAITAFLTGGVEGKMLLVVGQELVDALAGTPFGALEPAKALRPAMDAIASALGGRLDGEPTATPPEESLEVLSGGGTIVIIPLNTEDGLSALVGLSLTTPPPPAAAPAGRTNAAGAARSWGIEMLRDVEMEVTCELGRTRMTVRQLLALAPGDVVELDRLAGSPADLLVNGTLLARGEVVVVDESFGLRITEIVTRDAS